MRVDGFLGLYIQYKDIAAPVENFDRQVYAFPKSADRTCLVSNPAHIEILLKTGKYRVVGVEIAEMPSLVPNGNGHEVPSGPVESVVGKEVSKKKLGRPSKGRK